MHDFLAALMRRVLEHTESSCGTHQNQPPVKTLPHLGMLQAVLQVCDVSLETFDFLLQCLVLHICILEIFLQQAISFSTRHYKRDSAKISALQHTLILHVITVTDCMRRMRHIMTGRILGRKDLKSASTQQNELIAIVMCKCSPGSP